MSMNYAQMVEGCRHCKPAAQRALYDEFASMVLGVCQRYASCRDEANDLMQDSMVKVYENIGSLRDASKLQAWIYTVTLNTCLHFCRHKTRLTLEEDMDAYCSDNDELPFTAAEIVEAMNSVTPAQRLVFNLCCVEGMEYGEVASQLHCSETNVRGLLSRARARMRDYLKKIHEK